MCIRDRFDPEQSQFADGKITNGTRSAMLHLSLIHIWVSFREVPTRNQTRRSPTGGEVSTEPVVVMDTILVVRPRQVQFKWSFDKVTGTVSNTGNTWFKLLIKPG